MFNYDTKYNSKRTTTRVLGSRMEDGFCKTTRRDSRGSGDYNKGGWQNVNGLDIVDAAVGWGSAGVGVLATVGMVSNPVGWVVGIGTGIYFGARLVHDLSKD